MIQVKSAITRATAGHAMLEIRFSYRGKEYTAWIDSLSQKLLEPWGLVHMGAEFVNVFPEKEIPPDPENGRTQPLVARGFTDDPKIVSLAKTLRELADSSDFEVGVDLA